MDGDILEEVEIWLEGLESDSITEQNSSPLNWIRYNIITESPGKQLSEMGVAFLYGLGLLSI